MRPYLAALLLIGVDGTSEGSQTPPRYKLEVGQRITYGGKTESHYKDDKRRYDFDDEVEWTLWIVRKNPDGSWRVVLRSRTTSARVGENGERRASPAQTAMGYLDIHPDGRIAPNRSIGYHFDPLRLFPPLPADTQQAGRGWEDRRERDLAVRHFMPSVASSDGWAFEERYDSPLNRVSLTTATTGYLLDRDRGMLRRAETRKTRKYGIAGTEDEVLELKSVENRDPAWIERFGREADQLFAAYADYYDLEDRAVIDRSRHGKAGAVLAEARGKLTDPTLREQVDSMLAQHESRGSFGDRGDTFAQLLGKEGPAWEAKDLEGKVHAIKDYRGKVVLLDFWNRGCGWCIRAMPQLEALAGEFKGQPVQLLGMNLDEDEKDARLVVEQMGLTYPTLRAIGLAEGYKVGGIPHLVILDPEGRIADIHIGYAPTLGERVSRSVREILGSR